MRFWSTFTYIIKAKEAHSLVIAHVSAILCILSVVPHLFFGFFKAFRDKVHILEGGNEAFLKACGPGVKWLYRGLVWKCMLWRQSGNQQGDKALPRATCRTNGEKGEWPCSVRGAVPSILQWKIVVLHHRLSAVRPAYTGQTRWWRSNTVWKEIKWWRRGFKEN